MVLFSYMLRKLFKMLRAVARLNYWSFNSSSDSHVIFHRACVFLFCVCVCQTGGPGGETEGMGTQESVGGGRAARLFPGALSWP